MVRGAHASRVLPLASRQGYGSQAARELLFGRFAEIRAGRPNQHARRVRSPETIDSSLLSTSLKLSCARGSYAAPAIGLASGQGDR